jgi:hypothetical protein
MKILKAIGNFALKHTTVISLICFTIIFFFAAWTFGQEPTIKNGVFMMLWGVVFVSEVILLRISQVKEEQQDILRELSKLRHPSAGPKPQMIVVDSGKISADFEKTLAKGVKLFPEPKIRDNINADLRHQFGVQFPQGGIIPKRPFTGEPIKLSEGFSTDPRMTAKVTGEFPLTDEEWRNKLATAKETRDGEVAQERTIADPPADEAALTDEQWETIDKSDIGPNPQPETVREPFAWGPADMGKFEPATGYDMNDYSPDSPHYGQPHADCCK